jgi:hypothetical protein
MNKIILVVLTVVVGAVITFLYIYTLINQLGYVIVGSFVFPYVAEIEHIHLFIHSPNQYLKNGC